jgi:hypothetical protein
MPLTINAIEAGGALNGRVVAIELPPQTDQAH